MGWRPNSIYGDMQTSVPSWSTPEIITLEAARRGEGREAQQRPKQGFLTTATRSSLSQGRGAKKHQLYNIIL